MGVGSPEGDTEDVVAVQADKLGPPSGTAQLDKFSSPSERPGYREVTSQGQGSFSLTSQVRWSVSLECWEDFLIICTLN